MAWYDSANEAKKKLSGVTGISSAGDLLAPGTRTKDLLGSAAGGVGIASGNGSGGIDTNGRTPKDAVRA